MGEGEGEGPKGRGRPFRSPIGLGEAVALISVTIAGLGLCVSYIQWVDHQAEKREARQQALQQAQLQSALILRGEGGGSHLGLTPVRGEQVIQGQTFYFPSPLHAGPVQITGDGHIEARWFARGLKSALHGAADNGAEHDLPVAIVTTFIEEGQTRTDKSLYQLGFSIHRRLLQAAEVRIEGLGLARRGAGADPQATVNAAWTRSAPIKPAARPLP